MSFTSGFAVAKCGTGNPASYDDIEAVMLTQNGCGSAILEPVASNLTSKQFPHDWIASAFDCSTYWVLFWETGPAKFPTSYSQYNLRGSVGTFHLSATLAEARAVLQKDEFF